MRITRVFIANRGEIACRIAHTAHRLNIASCGVYTPSDAHTRHRRILQELRLLPAGDLAANYLNADLLIANAKEMGADAVHPGYGFLAENPEFAEKVAAAGLTWIGPSPAAMRALGGKIEAKEVARRAGVPVAPWMRLSDDPGDAAVDRIAAEIGLPALIKAAHGGGGRGQRVVRERSHFAEALRAARSEALRSFGSAEVFVERFLDRPRHIEVQVLGDLHGHVFAFGERDCTVQRRNQKVIEEAPAAVLDQAARERVHQAAIALASSAGYTNAGTVEFLAQSDAAGNWEFFFMELNARLQVEHPVTEEVYGVDLVELQFRSAEGEDLSARITSLPPPSGHAIELRLCAEDPSNRFLPTPGPVTEFRIQPAPNLRIETGFETGDTVPQEYDSLLAKIIVHAPTRSECLLRLREVLDQCMVAGLITNRSFLRAVIEHPDFSGNTIFTRWIDDHPELIPRADENLDRDLQYWGRLLSSQLFVQRQALPQFDVRDSLSQIHQSTQLLAAFEPDAGHGSHSAHGLVRVSGMFRSNGRNVHISGWITRFEMHLSFLPDISGIGQRRIAFAGQFEADDAHTHHGPIVSQVPGLVLDVRASDGATVAAHEPILVLEAMKIEMPISLPIEARITMIHVKAGERIQPGQTLITWEPAEQLPAG